MFGTGFHAMCDNPQPHTDLGPNQSACDVQKVTTRIECVGAPCTIGGPLPADWDKAYTYGTGIPDGANTVIATTPGKLTIRIHYRTEHGVTGIYELGPYSVHAVDALEVGCISRLSQGPRIVVTASARDRRLFGAGDSMRVESTTGACSRIPGGYVPAFDCGLAAPRGDHAITASRHGLSVTGRIRWDGDQNTCEVLGSS